MGGGNRDKKGGRKGEREEGMKLGREGRRKGKGRRGDGGERSGGGENDGGKERDDPCSLADSSGLSNGNLDSVKSLSLRAKERGKKKS